MIRRWLPTWMVTLTLLFSAQAHAVSKVEVEFSPGIAIPLGDYMVSEGVDLSQRVDSTFGFAGEITLVLNNIEFRYSSSVLQSGNVTTQISERFSEEFSKATVEINERLDLDSDSLPVVPPGEQVSQGEPITIHHLNLGYRFVLYDANPVVYLPLGAGLSLTTGPKTMVSRTLFGLSANLGVGFQYEITPWLSFGGAMRYLFTFSESSGDFTLLNAVTNFETSEDVQFSDHFYAGHVLHLSATAVIHF